MSGFEAKMHQLQIRLGLRPRPCWGSLQRSPDPLARFKGPTYKGEEGKEGVEEGEEFPLLFSADLRPCSAL